MPPCITVSLRDDNLMHTFPIDKVGIMPYTEYTVTIQSRMMNIK